MPEEEAVYRSALAVLRTAIVSAFALSLALNTSRAEAAEPAAGAKKPMEAVSGADKGKLQNPHKDDKQAVEAGHKLFMSAGCNGCHGGTGGGGMGPPLSNTVWVYGNDDDTLFRLITLGSQDLAKAGYKRKGTESVVGPMPPFKDIIKSEDDLWKIVTWIKSLGGKKQAAN
jgi:mono/diheme cytochrome c family protein